MNLKSVVTVEITKNGNTYTFNLPVGAPIGECYDACHEVLGHIIELAKQAAENAKSKNVASDTTVVENTN